MLRVRMASVRLLSDAGGFEFALARLLFDLSVPNK